MVVARRFSEDPVTNLCFAPSLVSICASHFSQHDPPNSVCDSSLARTHEWPWSAPACFQAVTLGDWNLNASTEILAASPSTSSSAPILLCST